MRPDEATAGWSGWPAPAKLNLFLRVLAREESGYHGVETLYCRVGLADALTIEQTGEAGRVTLDVEPYGWRWYRARQPGRREVP